MKFLVLFALIAFALADLQDNSNCLQYTWIDASGDEWIVDASSPSYLADQVYENWYMFVEGDNTYWFTLSSCATDSYPCPEGANACVLNSELGTTTVIGRFDQITETFDSGVSIVSVGDGCSKTSINLLCNESLSYNVSVEAEGCYTVINFSSDSVCPSINNFYADGGDWGYWNDKNRGMVMFAIIFSLIVTGICACLLITMLIVCCYKACTDKKYKKRENVMLENTKVAFQPLPTQEPAVPMVRFAPVSPLHPMSQLPQQYQYMQQPMVYFHPVAPQSQPAQIGQHTAVQVDEDEKLARKLQAELNAN